MRNWINYKCLIKLQKDISTVQDDNGPNVDFDSSKLMHHVITIDVEFFLKFLVVIT